MEVSLPDEVVGYLEELASRVCGVLGDETVAVYVGGSLALGGYQPGLSDIDVTAVCRSTQPPKRKRDLIAALRSDALPCPARGLEFVLYPQAELSRSPQRPSFELELNDGSDMPFVAHLNATERPPGAGGFWYGLDLAILRQAGIALVGPPAAEITPPVPRRQVLELLLQSLDWHAEHRVEAGENAVANASRVRYFVRFDRWVSKAAARAVRAPGESFDDLAANLRAEIDAELTRST